jgi:hypothetical protein
MENITSTTELKNAILLLEIEQRAQGLELKEQLASIKPLDLVKEAFKGDDESPGIIENVIVGGVGLATGYLTRKIFIGSSGNIFRKLLGTALQFGATSVITQNAQTIKSVGQLLLNLYPSKKKKKNPK